MGEGAAQEAVRSGSAPGIGQLEIVLGVPVALFGGCGIYGNVGRHFFPIDETVDGP